MLRAATFLGGTVPNDTTFEGRLGSTTTNSGAQFNSQTTSSSDAAIRIYNNNASYTGNSIDQIIRRAANAAFNAILSKVNDGADAIFKVTGAGEATCDGSFTGGGADHAWMNEWADGNPKGEDRVGYTAVIDEKDPSKIRLAKKGDTPRYVVIAPETATTLSNASPMGWHGKWARDDFKRRIEEEVEVEEVTANVDGVEVKERVKIARLKYAKDYNPNRKQTPRTERPEWAACSRMGMVRIRKGQPVNKAWVKRRDISDSVEEWEL